MSKRACLVLHVCGLVVAAALGLPRALSAQALIGAPAFGNEPIVFSASGGHVAALTPGRLLAEDQDSVVDVYLFTVASQQLHRVTRPALVGIPEPAASAAFIELLSISGDGRFLAYTTHRGAGFGTAGTQVLARYDFATGARLVIRDSTVDPFSQPVMSRDGSTFAWIGANRAVLVAQVGQVPVAVGVACPASRPDCSGGPALTANGRSVFYFAGGSDTVPYHLERFDRDTATRTTFPELRMSFSPRPVVTGDGRYVFATSLALDTSTRRVATIPVGVFAASDDGITVLFSQTFAVFDRRFSMPLHVAAGIGKAISADGRYMAGVRWDGVFLVLDLDGDGDGMSDPWETIFRLSPSDPADGAGDADGDGRSNRLEFLEGTHPRGIYQRHFAEGVSLADFQTRVHVFSKPPTVSGERWPPALVSFLGDDGSRGSLAVGASGAGEASADGYAPSSLLTSSQFSIAVESEQPFAAERLTTWGAVAAPGAHATSGSTPSTDWYFAEGATIGGLQLFYLLANPGDVPATVDVEYQLASGPAERRQHVVPARSRHTIWVNQEGGALGAAEVAAHLTSTHPIVAERAMYLQGQGGFTAGSASMGAHAPSTLWRFAEGATIAPFDTFFLLSNPSNVPAQVSARYLLGEGPTVVRNYEVPARSRRTIWVNDDAALNGRTFSTTWQASTAVVAERAMWWSRPGGGAWIEGHSELGATGTATRWLAAHVHESAFLLIANPSSTPGVVRVTMYGPNGVGAAETTLAVPPDSRTTFWPTQAFPALPPNRYSARIESLSQDGLPAAELVVERASYAPGLTAGSVFLATPIP